MTSTSTAGPNGPYPGSSYCFQVLVSGSCGTVDSSLIQQTTTGGTSTNTTYDHQNRLTAAGTNSYTPDPTGNLTAYSLPSSSVTADYNAANQLCNTSTTGSPAPCTSSSFTYDGAGSETHDAMNSINSGYNTKEFTTSVSQGGTTYDYAYADVNQSERVSMTDAATGTKTYFVNAPQGITSSSVIPTGGGATTTYYTRDSQGNLVDERTPNGTYYYLTDIRGSVIGLVDATGHVQGTYSYDPYGNMTNTLTATAQANPWRFDGAYQDPSGEYHMGARYYVPTLARWTQQDPAPASIADVNAVNRYPFAGDDPVNLVDPTGEFSVSSVASGCVAGVAQTVVIAGTAAAFGGAPIAGGDLVGSCVAGAGVSILNQLGQGAAGGAVNAVSTVADVANAISGFF